MKRYRASLLAYEINRKAKRQKREREKERAQSCEKNSILAALGTIAGMRAIKGRRFSRSLVKRRPRGGVGGKTRKKGFIRGRAGEEGAVGGDRFCVALRPISSPLLSSLVLSFSRSAQGYGFPRDVAHTMQRIHRHTRAFARSLARLRTSERVHARAFVRTR